MSRYLVFAVFSICLHGAEPDPRELFERARALQDRNENLNEAVRLYGAVIAQAKAHRALAARAQYEQGVLYERLGRRAEAEGAFAAVLRNFRDQPRIAALARSKLRATDSTPGTTNTLIWADKDTDSFGAPSPDGRYLSFTDWSTGNLAIRELATGLNRRVTHKDKPWAESNELALWSRFSPDGKRLAYTWWASDRGCRLMTINIDGKGERVLFTGAFEDAIMTQDWSGDGGRVLFSVTSGRSRAVELYIAKVQTGAIRKIGTPPGLQVGRALFTPDGRRIVYEHAQGSEDWMKDIGGVALDGSDYAPVIRHPADDTLAGWTPDGSRLVFRTNRSGSTEFWAASVRDGRAVDEPLLLQRAVGNVEPLGITNSGTLVYATSTEQHEVYRARIDIAARAVSKPRVVSERFANVKRSAIWSPDGRRIACDVGPTDSPLLLVIDLESGAERVVDLPVRFAPLLHWSGDQLMLGSGITRTGERGVFAFNVNTGEYSLRLRVLGDRPGFDGSGRYAYYTNQKAIMRHDVQSGEATVFYTHPEPEALKNPHCSVSGDQKSIALMLSNVPKGFKTLAIVPAEGGEPESVYSIPSEETFGATSLAWTPGDRALVVSRNATHGRHGSLWIVPLDGSAPAPLGYNTSGAIRSVHLNPSGDEVLFTVIMQRAEIWALDRFLTPALPTR